MLRLWIHFLFPRKSTVPELPIERSGGLTVGRAVVLLITSLVVNYLVALVVLAPMSPAENGEYTTTQVAFAGLCGSCASLLLVLRMATRVIGQALFDTEETEAGWVFGSPRFHLAGLGAGAIVAILSIGWQFLLPPNPDAAGAWFLQRLITTPGWTALFWWPTMIVVGPVLEELLFRGVLLGALTRKTGMVIATSIVTALFVATHFQALASYPWAIVPISFVGVVTALLRLKARAVGPAITLHATYNTVIGLTAVLSVWYQ